MQRTREEPIHANPCTSKILFPLLKRDRDPRPHSQPNSHKQGEKAEARSQRSESERKTNHKTARKTTDEQVTEVKKRRQKKDLVFFQKCFEHVMIQNHCLTQQLLIKDQQLDTLKLQVRHARKHSETKEEQQRSRIRKNNRFNEHSKHSSETNNFGQMEVILSVESQDECSLADHINPDKDITNLADQDPQKYKPSPGEKDQSSGECSRLDRLRMRKGLISRRGEGETFNLNFS